MRVCPRLTLLVTLVSLALAAAAAYADDGQGSPPTLGRPIYDIAHFDVIPATANGVDFHHGILSSVQVSRRQFVRSADCGAFELLIGFWRRTIRRLSTSGAAAKRSRSTWRNRTGSISGSPCSPATAAATGLQLLHRQPDRRSPIQPGKIVGTPWVSNSLPMTVGSSGALFVVTYVDFLQEVLGRDPDAGQNRLVRYGAASSKANPGNLLSYTVLRQIDRPNRYVFLEVWDTEPHSSLGRTAR